MHLPLAGSLSPLGRGGGAPASPLLDGLVSYWTLEEASGTRNDSHGGNHLTDNNTVTQVAGVIGSAGQFTRANSEWLSIADNAGVSTGDIDFTITAWVYLDSDPGEMMIVAKDNPSARDYHVSFSIFDRFQFSVYSAAGAGASVNALALGAQSFATWYFVVAWHDAVANTVNICGNDGAVNSASTAGLVVNDSGSEFQIGARQQAGNRAFWNGRIDNVGLWKRVLTAAERTALYNGGAGLAYPFS